MRGNTFGKLFSFTTFGESHGEALGVVIDGMLPGVEISIDDLNRELKRRAPGKIEGTTARIEADEAQILSGVFENKTLGTPIAVIVKNTNQKSSDYDSLKNEYRKGHADLTTVYKYGIRDHRGGGRSSGRETLSRVIAGYFAGLILKNVQVKAYISKLGPFEYSLIPSDLSLDFSPYQFPDTSRNDEIKDYLLKLKADGDSIGGKVRVIVEHCPKGLGEPVFDKLKADLGKALLSIGACVQFSFGFADEMSYMLGSEIEKLENAFGGIEGGITNGEPILLNLTFKPTSTIGEKAKAGRHDPCIMPRVIPVVEAMVKVVLADHYLRQKAYENKYEK